MEFDKPTFDQVQEVFLDDGAEALIACLTGLNRGQPQPDDASAAMAVRFGWIDPATQTLTPLGWMVSDSCREYTFWRQRARSLPFIGFTDALTDSAFHGKAVLEIGSGMGANLMSLGQIAASVEGVEPMAIYRQMGAILRQREGLPQVAQHAGRAEALPFADHSFDTVLYVTAHQYMELDTAMAEAARVLRPGGEVILIGGVWGTYLKEAMQNVPRRPAAIRSDVVTVANTLSYMATGRRVLSAKGSTTTSRPIYPTVRTMCRLLQAAGLRVTVAGSVLSNERLFRALKPAV
ncbi:MAG: class I SAM-dependent methyltransferase [Rhodobacterales bacterium]